MPYSADSRAQRRSGSPAGACWLPLQGHPRSLDTASGSSSGSNSMSSSPRTEDIEKAWRLPGESTADSAATLLTPVQTLKAVTSLAFLPAGAAPMDALLSPNPVWSAADGPRPGAASNAAERPAPRRDASQAEQMLAAKERYRALVTGPLAPVPRAALRPSAAWAEWERARLAEDTLGSLFAQSVFTGEQRNGRDRFEVQVELQQVNLSQSRLCGYLRIKELTEDHPNLCTFFEAELIGPHHSFVTNKWNADEFIDFQHWSKFGAFKPYLKQFNDPAFVYDFWNSEHVFMRWKEHFLVPDHRIKSIVGASFAGFYYICYHRRQNVLTGYYYHQNSEWFQRLHLTHTSRRQFSGFEVR